MAVSAAELDVAFTRFMGAWEEREVHVGRGGWEDVRVRERFGTKYLSITRTVTLESSTKDTALESDDEGLLEQEDDDEEALPKPPQQSPKGRKVIYDIVHSPSYQVPVLYISVPLAQSRSTKAAPPSLDEVYDLLVPTERKAQIQSVGVIGGLSMTDHPATGLPAWFVHPCRTQEVMSALAGEGDARPESYLLRLIGTVGSSVGLIVPVEVALALMKGEGGLGGG